MLEFSGLRSSSSLPLRRNATSDDFMSAVSFRTYAVSTSGGSRKAPEDPRRGGEPGVPRRRRQRAQGHPRRLRRAARVRRLQVLRRVLHHRRVAQHGHGRRHGQGHRVVRQRVGLLPEGRRPRRHRRRPMEVNAGRRHYCPVK
uniref:Uncharacterized protein n=1 Tax=Triticum urartu TaxID=4572 RepID=A0A8R7TJE7_TRIUA